MVFHFKYAVVCTDGFIDNLHFLVNDAALMEHIFCEQKEMAQERLEKIYTAYSTNPKAILKLLDECVIKCKVCFRIYIALKICNKIENERIIRNFTPEKIYDWRLLYEDAILTEYRKCKNHPSAYEGFKAIIFLLREKTRKDEIWRKVKLRGYAFTGEERNVFINGPFERSVCFFRALRVYIECKDSIVDDEFMKIILDGHRTVKDSAESAKPSSKDELEKLVLDLKIELFNCVVALSERIDLDLDVFRSLFIDIIKISDSHVLFDSLSIFSKVGMKQDIFCQLKHFNAQAVEHIISAVDEIEIDKFLENSNIRQFFEFLSRDGLGTPNKIKSCKLDAQLSSMFLKIAHNLAKSEKCTRSSLIGCIYALDWRKCGHPAVNFKYIELLANIKTSALILPGQDSKAEILTCLIKNRLHHSTVDDQTVILEIINDIIRIQEKTDRLGLTISRNLRMTFPTAIEFTKCFGAKEDYLSNIIHNLIIKQTGLEPFLAILEFHARSLIAALKDQAILLDCNSSIIHSINAHIKNGQQEDHLIIVTSSSESEVPERPRISSKQVKVVIRKPKPVMKDQPLATPSCTHTDAADACAIPSRVNKKMLSGYIDLNKKRMVEGAILQAPDRGNNRYQKQLSGTSESPLLDRMQKFDKLKEIAAKINENTHENQAVIIDKRDLFGSKGTSNKLNTKLNQEENAPASPILRADNIPTDMKGVSHATITSLADLISSRANSLFSTKNDLETGVSLSERISQRTNDLFSTKSNCEQSAESITSFFEECLNLLAPTHTGISSPVPDSFLSFQQYWASFNPLRANENRTSIRASLFDNSKYFQAKVHNVSNSNSIVRFRIHEFTFEQHDILYFSTSRTSFKIASMNTLARDIENGAFLGILITHTAGYFEKNHDRCDLVEVQVSKNITNLKQGQPFFYKYVGNIVTSLREFNALKNISNSRLLKYVLRPSFLNDFMKRGVSWDEKRKSIVIDRPSDGHAYPAKYNENVPLLETLLMNMHNLNESQARAVSTSFYSKERFCLIQGPPGTGKTTTILSIISTFLLFHGVNHATGVISDNLSSKKILVCAPSNTAIDVIVLRMSKGFRGFSGQNIPVPFIRVGYSTNALVNEYTLEYLVNTQGTTSKMKARNEIVTGASVVFSTLSSSASEYMNETEFDLLIIDEACQSTELSILIPLKYNPTKVIMIGDPCQLPPTVISSQSQLERSLFERMLAFHQPALLDMQYRMNEKICNLSSHFFYNDMIKTARMDRGLRDVSKRDFTLNCSPLNFVDIPVFHEKVDELKSYYNPFEVNVCSKICEEFHRKYKDKIKVVDLSPYKAQVLALKANYILKKLNIEINTIDAFQGKEADVVILSTVRQSGLGFTSDFRRINVAITRSRECLIILGNAFCLSKNQSWAQIIQYMKSKAGFIPTQRIPVLLKNL